MAGSHGGARPGAGRPSRETVERQRAMRDVIYERAAPEWPAIIDRAVKDALAGNRDARQWLTPWIVGAPPAQDLNVHVDTELAIVQWPTGWEPPQLDEPHTIEHEDTAVPPQTLEMGPQTLLPPPSPVPPNPRGGLDAVEVRRPRLVDHPR